MRHEQHSDTCTLLYISLRLPHRKEIRYYDSTLHTKGQQCISRSGFPSRPTNPPHNKPSQSAVFSQLSRSLRDTPSAPSPRCRCIIFGKPRRVSPDVIATCTTIITVQATGETRQRHDKQAFLGFAVINGNRAQPSVARPLPSRCHHHLPHINNTKNKPLHRIDRDVDRRTQPKQPRQAFILVLVLDRPEIAVFPKGSRQVCERRSGRTCTCMHTYLLIV